MLLCLGILYILEYEIVYIKIYSRRFYKNLLSFLHSSSSWFFLSTGVSIQHSTTIDHLKTNTRKRKYMWSWLDDFHKPLQHSLHMGLESWHSRPIHDQADKQLSTGHFPLNPMFSENCNAILFSNNNDKSQVLSEFCLGSQALNLQKEFCHITRICTRLSIRICISTVFSDLSFNPSEHIDAPHV